MDMDKALGILTEHSKDNFQQFYDIGYRAESIYGCCGQCMTVPFVELLGVDEKVFQYASGFCAGFGIKGEYPCGAFSGGILILASFFGRTYQELSQDVETGKERFRYTSALARTYEQRFKEAFGHTMCHRIQTNIFGRSFNLLDREHDFPLFEQMGAHCDKCTNVVGTAARLVAQILFEELSARQKS